MMVLSSQTSHFSQNNGMSDSAHSSRTRLLNGSGVYSGDSRMPRSSHSITPSQSPSPPIMYVRALYNYAADDPTSLSFSQGDMIQVLTQLESGWWDGIVNGQRGWFPSNYCAVVQNSELTAEQQNGHLVLGNEEDDDIDDEEFDDYDDNEDDDDDKELRERRTTHLDGSDASEQDEAAFWLPQVTADGRLYYFNTMTGASKMELPLETPSANNETGPRDRSTYTAPDQTRPPPELMAAGYEHEDGAYGRDDADGDAASDKDGEMILLAMPSPVRDEYRQSTKSNRSSSNSYASNKKLNSADVGVGERAENGYENGHGNRTTSFATEHDHDIDSRTDVLTFYDDTVPTPSNWDSLIEETQFVVDRYRQALARKDRKQYVSRAEDISDMLRLLIAAGSSTTDNHSGQPTIISSNKNLHPHFRHFMAAFSKLVLSSHVASTDWPPADAEAKCLAEADEVIAGVLQFGEVARAQRDDIVPRLNPGFVVGSNIGGSWYSNGLGSKQARHHHISDATGVNGTPLDSQLVEKLEALRGVVIPSLRQLDNALEMPGPISTTHQQGVVGAFVISAAQNAVDSVRAYFQFLDSINLAPLSHGPRSPTLVDFSIIKQRLYDSFAELFMSCQQVTSPLSDEWTSVQGLPLEDRLNEVRIYIKEMEQGVQSLVFTAQLLVEERESRLQKNGKDDYRKMSESQMRDTMSRPGQYDRVMSKGRPRAGSSSAERSLNDSMDVNATSNAKLKKFFGAEPVQRREVEETPWFLGNDTDESVGIAYDAKGAVRGGTLEVLVERLTRHDFLDSAFNNTFLLTYRSFTTANQLFKLLTDRFNIQNPPNLSPQEYDLWAERKQKPIRLRVLNILKSWFETYWMEPKGEAETELLQQVLEFARGIMAPAFPNTSALINLVEQRMQGRDPFIKILLLNLSTTPPPPIYPKNMRKLKFLDIDPLEFARQLTIIESRAYTKIKPTECLGKAWSKPADAAPDPAENVKAMILHSNQLTNWVAEMILCQQEVKKRVVVIKHFISVAEKCRSLNNFSTLTAIISALSTSPIHRLKRTWDQVHTRTSGALESMRVLMGTTRNFGEYREMLHVVNPPCVPFLGVYLTDLTFIEDGNPDFIKKTDLINFAKRAKTAEVIREIQQYQLVPYPLQAVDELQQYILSNMQAAKDVHEMYDLSLQIEPREREDEKIARLLQESGFL